MSKSLEPFNFRQRESFVVDQLAELVESFDDEWYIDTSRQDTFKTHKETLSYFVYKANTVWWRGKELEVVKSCSDKALLDLIEPIVRRLENEYQGTRGNVLLIKLLAGKVIPEHVDGGDYLEASRRIHVPIKTSKNTVFKVGGEAVNMAVGECWEINNFHPHSVDNSNGDDRVHLLIDVMPNTRLPGRLRAN